MSAHRRRRRRSADGPKFHPFAFGGWGDYKTWAEHQFLPKPIEDVPDDEVLHGEVLDGEVPDHEVLDAVVPDGARGGDATADLVQHQRPIELRPYVLALAGGPPHRDDLLRIDSLISLTPEGAITAHSSTLSEQYRQIFDMCQRPTPVVEIAARLRVPIGAAFVLIGDAIGWNLLKAPPPPEVDGQPSLELIIRVYEGLRRLA
ncbi:hypothetical protein GCM10009555_070530 [Acrocarpospora macrocephala]|uniref:DUF742 domain-containing protein n=1 Tax=Acrocarpospora macrocephala TaxID=150177 RepID=A0A5M3WLW7_9ACTN|nr:DUF742 domain-containing protein [Acrocarpospora macrocephala]GES10265.1 hypothetical protein Amac_038620 [Acrocarpospora macrocephala]